MNQSQPSFRTFSPCAWVIALILIFTYANTGSGQSVAAAPSVQTTQVTLRPGVTQKVVVTLTPTSQVTRSATIMPTRTSLPRMVTPSPTGTATRTPLADGAWKNLPVIPVPSQTARHIYQRGLELGNNSRAFSKIGDCGSTPTWFLGDFDSGPRYYNLGAYTSLEGVIAQYQGSFGRLSFTAHKGFNASSVFSRLWTDRSQCDAGETPLACEYRLHRPILALVMLGTNDIWHRDTFESSMRKIIEFSIEKGVLPVLSTKADNGEGDGSINATIARLAWEYDLPLWNFWAAVQPLPDHGLLEDRLHLTWGPNSFDNPDHLQRGWPVRNLTALQTLDSLWRGLAKR